MVSCCVSCSPTPPQSMTCFSLRIGRQDERFSDRHRFSFRVSTGILHAFRQSPQLSRKHCGKWRLSNLLNTSWRVATHDCLLQLKVCSLWNGGCHMCDNQSSGGPIRVSWSNNTWIYKVDTIFFHGETKRRVVEVLSQPMMAGHIRHPFIS